MSSLFLVDGLRLYKAASVLTSVILGSEPSAAQTPLTLHPKVFRVRRDNHERATLVHVFDSAGNRVYSFQRNSMYTTLWRLYREPGRENVAIIRCGLFARSVDFIGKPGLQHRQIGQHRRWLGGIPDNRFYLADAAPYEWTRTSQFLERIVNSASGQEEIRERLARIRLMRTGRFDWELLVDPNFDDELAIATGFIAMQARYSRFAAATPGAVTRISQPH